MSSQRKPINSLGFYLISNSWKNPRWRPCLVMSQTSSSAITGFQPKSKSFRNTATFQNLRKGVPSTPPSPPNPLVPRWGRTLSVGPRVKVKWFYFSYSSSHLKDKKKATVICLKDVDWWDEEHLVCSVSHWVYSDIYNQRLHSHCLCKKPPSTQTQYVPDNEPDCSWCALWSRRGTWHPLVFKNRKKIDTWSQSFIFNDRWHLLDSFTE